MTVEERFWKKVSKRGEDECWLWTGAKIKAGYGALTTGSRTNGTKAATYAHRISWELAFGAIPAGRLILHRCDNPPCVNPNHLFIGDNKANVDDMVQKNRWRNQYKDNPPTHCKRNHPFDEKNTGIDSHGNRRCRACSAMWTRVYTGREAAPVDHPQAAEYVGEAAGLRRKEA